MFKKKEKIEKQLTERERADIANDWAKEHKLYFMEYPNEPPTIGEFLRIQDVVGFFKYDINPSYHDAVVEAEVAMVRKEQRTVPFQWIMMIAIIMIAGMVAYVGISGVVNNNQCNKDLLACHGVQTGNPTSSPGGIVGAIQQSTGSSSASIS